MLSYRNLILFLLVFNQANAQISDARRTGFSWINTQNVTDPIYGAGYSMYSAVWPIFEQYPGSSNFQMGLGSAWMTTQPTGNEPSNFYTTIEGGLGWWGDTRFGTKIPKFIMGGVSHDFYSWANGPGAGRSDMLSNGQRDWSTPQGKYGIAQLSNKLLWAPDGLNLAQGLNGELLGYGYHPLPLTDPMTQTAGTNIPTGNQCWTLFFNTTNFKGPATFFLPTFWTEPVLSNPALDGLFLDTRPSNPNSGFGMEHALSPAIVSPDSQGVLYAKIERMHFPKTIGEDYSVVLNEAVVYSKNALWNAVEAWFNGTAPAPDGLDDSGILDTPFINNGGSIVGEIFDFNTNNEHGIDLTYIDNTQPDANTMGYDFDLNDVDIHCNMFILPEYFRLDPDNTWRPINESQVPQSTNLVGTDVPRTPRTEIAYLSPKEADCHIQDPNSPWNSPGPAAGPFFAELEDGSTLTYYWYKFNEQPAIVQANLPQSIKTNLQNRVELIHSNWSHTDEFLLPPSAGSLATLDPNVIVEPPAGLEVGYVPIVTRQEKSSSKLRVFVLAGQSNMEGHGSIVDPENDPGSLVDVIQNDTEGHWSRLGDVGNWNTLDDAWLYYEKSSETIKANVTAGQGANSNLIGPELMFAHQLDDYYEDPVLIIKTAWGGKNLAEDFRPPSAGGTTGAYYNSIIQTVQNVTQNLASEFPNIGVSDYEISGFAWFQGWNDGASEAYLNEYESNLYHLVNDIRNDLGNPLLPFVIASSGHGGYLPSSDPWVQDMQDIVSVAQENVGCDDPTYEGWVGFVDTKQFYVNSSESPDDSIHHFNNNALTFLNIGKYMGKEMIKAINNAAYCYDFGCEGNSLSSPGFTSIGNRVWNDLNQNGINDPDEPGIPDVSLVIWYDSDGDQIPDWQGFGGVEKTDSEGYYRFSGLPPGNYSVFVWSVDNWEVGQPLHGFVSTNNFVADANNDVDLDNNGSGNPFTDIFAGIVTLSLDGEPLDDGDPEDCFYDYDPGGNNTVDFGFYNPNLSNENTRVQTIEIVPNPVVDDLKITNNHGLYQIEIIDLLGRTVKTINPKNSTELIDVSSLQKGVYFVKLNGMINNTFEVHKIIKR